MNDSRPPKIPESVLVVIHSADLQVLLIERADKPGFWQSVTGSKDAVDEPFAETARREVAEETGVGVGPVHYLASQPWPFPHSLMIAFTAQYAGGDIRVDASEIAEARWFGPQDPLPPIPPLGLSIAGHLIHAHLPQSHRAKTAPT